MKIFVLFTKNQQMIEPVLSLSTPYNDILNMTCYNCISSITVHGTLCTLNLYTFNNPQNFL